MTSNIFLPVGIFRRIDDGIKAYVPQLDKPTIWIHIDSMDSIDLVRPIIVRLASNLRCILLLTVSSERDKGALMKEYISHIDHIFVLPADTLSNAAFFIEQAKPDVAVFAASKCYSNYLVLLRSNHIPSFLIAAYAFPRFPIFFKWSGTLNTRKLRRFSHIFVMDRKAVNYLRKQGISHVYLMVNPLMDESLMESRDEYCDSIIEKFAADEKAVFIAGNIDSDMELKLVAGYVNANPHGKCILIPHSISEEHLDRIKYKLDGKTLLYSECDENTDFSDVQTLVIDFLGSAKFIYRYGSYAYVGGESASCQQNVFEAIAQRLPTAFGPRTAERIIYRQLLNQRICHVVRSSKDISRWINDLVSEQDSLGRINASVKRYAENHRETIDGICTRIINCL